MMPMLRSVPAMVKRPPGVPLELDVGDRGFQHMRRGVRPFSITSCAASTIAAPEAISDLEPPVPPPAISRSLSPWTRRMLSKGTPSWLCSTWAKGVQWPWP